MPDPERQPVEEQELPTDPNAYLTYLLLSEVKENQIVAGETVGEEE